MSQYATEFGDYVASMDFDPQVFRDMQDIATQVNGTLGLSNIGRVVITLPEPTAVAAAANISDADFPWGYVIPGTDSTLVFNFF